MNPFFNTIFTLGLMASAMALIALGIRTCFRRMPRIYTYVLWIFVFIRAILPISYSSSFSLWTLFQKAPSQTLTAEQTMCTVEPSSLPFSEVDTVQSLPRHTALHLSQKTAPDPQAITAVLWAIGILALLLYSTIAVIKLRQTVRFCVRNQKFSQKCGFSVYESDRIQTAFVLGFFHPCIYLPANLSDAQKYLILEHESTHIRRHDHQIKIAAWLILSLHWFQPLLWVSFYFLDKDMELSCDEQVLKNLGTQVRTDYSSLLLKVAAQDNFPVVPISFCSGSSKNRIKHVLRYRPQKTLSSVLTILLIGATLYGCMGSPQEKSPVADTETPLAAADLGSISSDTSNAPESEELAFVKEFLSSLAEASTNIIADDIYEMLAPKLQAEITSYSSPVDIRRLDTPGHYSVNYAYGPFLCKEPLITEEADGTFRYQMTPADSNPESYRWGNEDYGWEGSVQVERNADGHLKVSQWENYFFEKIISRTSCIEHYSDSSLQLIAESIPSLEDWKQTFSTDSAEKTYYDTFGDPSVYLENCLHLTDGEVSDIKTDDATQDKHITYTWKDGAVVFHMQYREQDKIWVPFKIS